MTTKNEEKIYSLADLMKSKRKILDVYVTINTLEELLKKQMSGYEISKAKDLFRKEYPDLSDD